MHIILNSFFLNLENIIEPNEDEPGLGKILVPGEPLFLQCKTEECPYCSIVWYRN